MDPSDFSNDYLGQETTEPVTKLLEQAENDPAGAIASWIKLFEADADPGLGALLTHERALNRVLEIALSNASHADLSISALAAQARSKVEAALAARPLETISRQFDGPSEPLSLGLDQLVGHLGEAAELNRKADKWRGTGGLQWAINGILALEEDRVPHHLAFLPLRLYPRGRFIEQAAGALRDADAAGMKVTQVLRRQIENDLERSASLLPLDLRIGPSIWRLYAGIGPGNQVDNIATRYLLRLIRVGDLDSSAGAAIADAIADTVAEASISTSTRGAFFRRWRREFPALWTPHVAIRWFKSQLDDVAAVSACGDAVGSMLSEIWKTWNLDHRDDPNAIFSHPKWGPVLRGALESAAELRSEFTDPARVFQGELGADSTTIEMEPAQSLEVANIFEEA